MSLLVRTLSERAACFSALVAEVQKCIKCPRMSRSARVLSATSGKLDSKLMFIAEAPGRHGANKTRIPLHGDKTGDNFERLLAGANISRGEVFITNAVLCNPKDEKKEKNAKPNRSEIDNCNSFLKRQIQDVNPLLVVTLGKIPLAALCSIERHNLVLSEDVGKMFDWFGRSLIPLYHPSPQAMLYRDFSSQQKDYTFVAEKRTDL